MSATELSEKYPSGILIQDPSYRRAALEELFRENTHSFVTCTQKKVRSTSWREIWYARFYRAHLIAPSTNRYQFEQMLPVRRSSKNLNSPIMIFKPN